MHQLDQLILSFRAWRESLPLSAQVAFDFLTGMVIMRGFIVPMIVAGIKKVFSRRDRLIFWHFHNMASDKTVARRPFIDN